MKSTPLAGRLLFALAYGALLGSLWAGSPFVHLAPAPGPLTPFLAGWLTASLLVAGVLLPDRPPLPGLLALATPAMLAAGYDASAVDWSLLLKDWGLATGGGPDPVDLLLGALTVLAAFAWHLLDQAYALRARYEAKGSAPRETGLAVAALRRGGGRLLVDATLALAGAALVFLAAHPLLRLLDLSDALLTPLLAGGLLVAAALLALPRDRDETFES